MTQRISDDILESLIARHRPERRQVTDLVELDLRDSRSEVSRLQGEVERLRGLIENSKDGGK